ncbi:MAG: RodZ domain-containing protein [Ignavibacteriaceae bacterium]
MFEQLAEELKQARIKCNLSIQQLSNVTRIDIKFIEAMENGDFSFLPELYVKAFTKQYAKAVNLDENIIIKKYEASKKGIPYEEEPAKQETKRPIELAREVKKEPAREPASSPHVYSAVKSPVTNPSDLPNSRKKVILSSIFVGIIAIFAIMYFFFLRQSHEIIVPEKPIEQVIKENKQRYIANEKTDSLANKSISSDSLNLTIMSKDTSWIKIIVDDKKVDDFILFPHSQKDVVAGDNFKITIGNSSGIELNLNNKSLNFEGKRGQVKYVSINKGGLKYLSNPPVL